MALTTKNVLEKTKRKFRKEPSLRIYVLRKSFYLEHKQFFEQFFPHVLKHGNRKTRTTKSTN